MEQYAVLNHPQTDFISVQGGRIGIHGNGVTTVEIAFFKNHEFVVEPIEEFTQWHDGSAPGDLTAVYNWVPKNLVDDFISKYEVKE